MISSTSSRIYPPIFLVLICLTLFLIGLDKINEATDPTYEDTVPYLKVTTYLQDHGALANSWSLFVQGEHKTVVQHPLYPLLLASLGAEPQYLFAAGKLLSLVIGVAVIAAFFVIVRRLYGDLTAYVATLLLAFNATFIGTVSHVKCESLLSLFVLLSVYWMILGAKEQRHWRWAGAAAGLAYFTKGTGFLLLPVFAATSVLNAGFRVLSRRTFWLFFLFFALFASPLIVRNVVVYHHPFYEGANSRVQWLDDLEGFFVPSTGFAIKFPEKVWDEDRFPTIRSYLATHSATDIVVRFRDGVAQEASLLLSSLETILLPEAHFVGPLVFLLFAVGLARASHRAEMICVITVIAAFFFPFAWYYQVVPKSDGAVRFIAPLVPWMCLYAAVGIVAIVTAVDHRLASRRPGFSLQAWIPPAVILPLVPLILYVLTTQDSHLPENLTAIPQENAELHQWLEQNMRDDDVVMVSGMTPFWRYLWLSKFHGKWTFWHPPNREIQAEGAPALTRLLASKRASHNRYIVLHQEDIARHPALHRHVTWNERDGFRIDRPIEGWTLVYRHSQHPSSFLIFQVEPGAQLAAQ